MLNFPFNRYYMGIMSFRAVDHSYYFPSMIDTSIGASFNGRVNRSRVLLLVSMKSGTYPYSGKLIRNFRLQEHRVSDCSIGITIVDR